MCNKSTKFEFVTSTKMQPEYASSITDCSYSLQYFTCRVESIKNTYNRTTANTQHNIYGPAVIGYYPNGTCRVEIYFIKGHRDNGHKPAKVEYHPNGSISVIKYFINDQLHNDRGPAWTEFYPDGTKSLIEYWKTGEILETR